jgi:aminopeptidase YwaD
MLITSWCRDALRGVFCVAGAVSLLWGSPAQAQAQQPPLLSEGIVAALAQELSGESAQRMVEALALHHRMRGSTGFRAAANHIVSSLRAAGIADAAVHQLPADGRVFYGTQRSRPPWNAEFAELWELRESGSGWVRSVRLASWDAMPMSLAQDSESGEVTAELVDIGAGTADSDYAGRDVRGKLVLTSSQPEAVVSLAVERFGAAGIVSWAQNQRSAWWGENGDLVRWGHLDAFAPVRTFAFMVSPNRARALRARLAAGEHIRMHAVVRAGKADGAYEIAMATIPGAQSQLSDEEIAFSCHLDHPRPGANDNASGCASLYEIARALHKLIGEGRVPRPARTLRFIWPPEIEGTMALLAARPEIRNRIRAVVHLDMVGGGPETKAVFHVVRGPVSLPSFIYDVGQAFGEFVSEQSYLFAASGDARFPLVAPQGGREPLQARLGDFSMGSDHQVYTEGSFRIPAIYMNDWPDRYIHTNFDRPEVIDPTKLLRASFIGAASGYFLANAGPGDAAAVERIVRDASLRRTATMLSRRDGLDAVESANVTRHHLGYERAVVESMSRFFAIPADVRARADTRLADIARLVGGSAVAGQTRPGSSAAARTVYRRNAEVPGPVSVFGYDYLYAHYGADRVANLRLLRHRGLHGTSPATGGEYAYEALNLVDGRRSVQEIRDALSAAYGPVPTEYVIEYMEALREIGLVSITDEARQLPESGAPPSRDAGDDELLRVHREMLQAMIVDHNVRPFDAVALDQLLLIPPGGILESKAEALAGVGAFAVTEVVLEDETVVRHGSTAVVIAKMTLRGEVRPVGRLGPMRTLSAFVLVDGEWRLLARSLTPCLPVAIQAGRC